MEEKDILLVSIIVLIFIQHFIIDLRIAVCYVNSKKSSNPFGPDNVVKGCALSSQLHVFHAKHTCAHRGQQRIVGYVHNEQKEASG